MADRARSSAPLAIQLSHPYLRQGSIDESLMSRRNVSAMSETKEWQMRLAACAWMQNIAKELQFPVRTLGTAMMIFHRFHLFHAITDFNTNDVIPACLFVASKMEDTAKKAKDILIAVHTLRNPQSPEIDPESSSLEEQRRRVLGLERMILETQSFDFRQRHPQAFIIKFARLLKLESSQTRQAWDISLDSYRTWLPLKIPPHAVALACILLAVKFSGESVEIEPDAYEVESQHLFVALEDLLDLYLHYKAHTTAENVCTEGRLMEIKSTLIKDRKFEEHVNGKQATAKRKVDNLSSIGDRGTCRYVLDPDRLAGSQMSMDIS